MSPMNKTMSMVVVTLDLVFLSDKKRTASFCVLFFFS